MIRFAFIVLFPSLICAQIDQEELIVGRNSGTKLLHDGNSTRIFGFAQSLGALIDIPGPTLYFNEGDSIEIDFFNMSQGAPHTIHLHGLDVNQQNDGVPHLSFEVMHQGHGYYRFMAPHPGTYIYHCHVASTIHVQAGMYGVIIVRPLDGATNVPWSGGEVYDREFLWTASEIDTNWHTDAVLDHPHVDTIPMLIPDTYQPQYFFNSGLSGTQLSDPINFYTAGENEKIYVRLVNIGYQGVRYIFPSVLSTRTVSSDGRPLPSEWISDTVEVLPGERYGAFIQTGSDALYGVTMEHFNLNTQQITSSQTISIRTSQAIVNAGPEFIFKPYPNPSAGFYKVPIEWTSDEIIFEDVLGNKLPFEVVNGVLNIQDLPSGIYLLKRGNCTHKLLKD